MLRIGLHFEREIAADELKTASSRRVAEVCVILVVTFEDRVGLMLGPGCLII